MESLEYNKSGSENNFMESKSYLKLLAQGPEYVNLLERLFNAGAINCGEEYFYEKEFSDEQVEKIVSILDGLTKPANPTQRKEIGGKLYSFRESLDSDEDTE